MTSIQTLPAIAQHSPPAIVTKSPAIEAPAVDKTLHPINNEVSIIDEAPTTSSITQGLLKVSILHKVHLASRSLVIDFPGEEPMSSNDDKED
uniref:Uncharacterized protein n=1 Tax=Romanomermis culicivorax TaxID=13658 RepID=A0A915KWC6_ROMCU